MTNQQSKLDAHLPTSNLHSHASSSSSPNPNQPQIDPLAAAAAELASLFAFLIQLCLNGSSAHEQRSIARFILGQFSQELEQHSGTYSFLLSPTFDMPSIPSVSASSSKTTPIISPRKLKQKQSKKATLAALIAQTKPKKKLKKTGSNTTPTTTTASSTSTTTTTAKSGGSTAKLRRKSEMIGAAVGILDEPGIVVRGNGSRKSIKERSKSISVAASASEHKLPKSSAKIKSKSTASNSSATAISSSAGPSSPRHHAGAIVKKPKAKGSRMVKSKSTMAIPIALADDAPLKAMPVKRRRPVTTAGSMAAKYSSPPKASRPNTSSGSRLNEDAICGLEAHQIFESNVKKAKSSSGEMLQRLFKAIEFTTDQLTTIALCRLLQGFVRQCDLEASKERLRICTKLDGTSHLMRAIRARLERQKHKNPSDLGSQLALDVLGKTLLCISGKDRKLALKIRLNGLLSALANHMLVLDAIASHTADGSEFSFGSVNLLRLTAKCLRSNRNAQLLGRERHFAERFVCTLNAASALLELEHQSTEHSLLASSSSTLFAAMSSHLSIGLAQMDDDGTANDELLLAGIAAQNGGNNTGEAKMARLVECLFFLTKFKRNKTQLQDQQCLPVLKTIFETHFRRRNGDLVHREIALIALATLRQFAATKKGRDVLMSLCTLDMCEHFIAELTLEEEQKQFDTSTPNTAPLAVASVNTNAQLQDSLCALCLRCLPPQQFPHRLDQFPIKFELPKVTAVKGTPGTPRMKKMDKQQKGQKFSSRSSLSSGSKQQQKMDEDEAVQSSDDEDYGIWTATGIGADPEDSLMSCSGDRKAEEDISMDANGIEYSENEELEEKESPGKPPPMGSARAVEQYSRQQKGELITNYEKFFMEFTTANTSTLPAIFDEFSAPDNSHGTPQIESHEQIVRRILTHKTRSVMPFAKIAFPELLDCGDQIRNGSGQMALFGAAEIADTAVQNEITASSDSTRHLIVRRMVARFRDQQNSATTNGFKRRVVFDLDKLLLSTNENQLPMSNDDAEKVGKFVEAPSGGHLHFESRFESGNLWKAVQVAPTEYELAVSPDINQQQPHFQWFHFQVAGMRKGVAYTFEIVNCLKSVSMFSRGMQPVLFSVAEATVHGRPGWVRAGTQIAYFRNLYSVPENLNLGGDKENNSQNANNGKKLDTSGQETPRRLTRSSSAKISMKNGNKNAVATSHEDSPDSRTDKAEGCNFFSLRFTVEFEHEGDICYIAYHFPYTYTRLQATLERCLHSKANKANPTIHIRRQLLCHSLAGVPLPLATITSSAHSPSAKQLLLISARVHPGETNSSWIMHGLIQFLLSDHPLALRARELFIFKLIPMLNPDGVINGSHRCSLTGVDLNRVWNDPSPALHPTIFHAKGIIQYMVDILGRRPFVFVDLHGHSRKPNIFMYGNNPEESWRQADRQQQLGAPDSVESSQPQFAQLPLILDKISDSFAFKDCAFSITKAKEYSARVATWRQFGLERVYTMESTYWGFDQGPKAGSQITITDLKRMGAELVEGLVQLHEQTANANPFKID